MGGGSTEPSSFTWSASGPWQISQLTFLWLPADVHLLDDVVVAVRAVHPVRLRDHRAAGDHHGCEHRPEDECDAEDVAGVFHLRTSVEPRSVRAAIDALWDEEPGEPARAAPRQLGVHGQLLG